MKFLKNVITSIPEFLATINPDNYLKPINNDLPINGTSNQNCSFAHLPKSSDNYRNVDSRCANDIDIIGQEMHVVESGLFANDYLVTTGTVVTNINRMVCLDNIVKYNDKHQIVLERTTFIINNLQHRFAFIEGLYSERHANISPNEYARHDEYLVSHPDMECSNYANACGDWIPPGDDLVWCHRGCVNDGFGGVELFNWALTGKPGDCVTLFDIDNRPTSTMVKMTISHGNQTIDKELQTDITLHDNDIARISTNLILKDTRLIEYKGNIYNGGLGDSNSYATADYNLNFAYNCVKNGQHATWRNRIENVVSWSSAYPSLPGNRVMMGTTAEMTPFTDSSAFNSTYFDQKTMVINGGQNTRITYTFKTYSKIKSIFQVNGAVDDFECYFKGENIFKVKSFTCVVTKVAIDGVANLMIYNATSCQPLYTGQIQAALRAQIEIPVIFSGQNRTMKICTQLGTCKTYEYSTERIIIDPTANPGTSTNTTGDFHWDWLNNFFGTLFYAIGWWWNNGGWFGKIKSILAALAFIVVIVLILIGLFYLKRLLCILRLVWPKKHTKKTTDSKEENSEEIRKTVVLNI